MRGIERAVDGLIDHSRAVIVVMLVLTLVVGTGASMVEQSSSLDQFQTDSPEAETLDYIGENFSTGSENTTTAQVIVRDDNVLDRESLVGLIEYQQTLRANETVNGTLAEGSSTASIANALATAAIQQEAGRDVQSVAAELRALNRTVTEERRAIEARNRTLSATAGSLERQLTVLRQNPNASVSAAFADVRANTSVDLNESDAATFRTAAQRLRDATSESAAEEAYRLGTEGVLAAEYQALQERSERLQSQGERLEALAEELSTERAELANASNATLAEQRAQLESMNASEVDAIVATVLGAGSSGGGGGSGAGVFALMPTDYEPGSTTAEATMLIVTQSSHGSAVNTGSASDAVTDAQLAMQALAGDAGGSSYLVFGSGVIAEEITNSMTDSLLIVGPLALLFVLVALAVAYRDLLDIVLGLVGIGAVLLWTFGFMGWADIAFNQIFIAVPVLLIGLSIDYAIHIFMRHREERTNGDGDDDALAPRGSMRTALTGVGIALVYVTATTVIGFLSNLTSPVPPIRDFGVVSSVGIVAALAVFGLLIPAIKVELDELLESRGIDRTKRAFGTGGGAFSSVLSVGATGARKAPYLVILLAVLVSAGGAYGATQVDTAFSQEDFLAEDPPGWMDELPEPFAPSDYSAKQNLQYVNDNFVRQDSQAQVLVEGEIARAETLDALADAQALAAEKGVTQTLSNGDARITSPLTVMRSVAASNESFNATLAAADTDGDGVPDRDVAAVYDALYETAPDEAAGVLSQTDGRYEAARLVVAIEGGADGDAITTQMRDVAAQVDGSGLEATATGSAILNKIVQDELLNTVVQSLVITLVATFVFLMITYRITEGSATLGVVTLLPVAFSVMWILGTMYLLDIPFNVLTGMITSLTVGLGVAYSIHLSERYNQELTRTRDVWTAMDRAVTGTGGALLGSAATTVGGFGTLVFAILPPLQQFGTITGLTIVYAFLASVLVLPSLLVVWTRFVEPDGIGLSDGDDPSDGATAPTASVTDAPVATRELSRTVAGPGETVTATVRLRGVDDRVVLREETGGDATVVERSPDPVDVSVNGGSVYVAWDGGEPAITYEVAVPADARDGERLGLEGEALLAGESSPVEGDAAVEVVTNVFERITASGSVSQSDLRAAYDRFEAGALSRSQLERVNRAWLRDGEVTVERPADD
ncbi:MMPL family transporter [Halosimplex rubrum]|uniref:MMPL family transporter n=1 Tax=Halosimplex rubrum TaxID=869889 RepID=A0A7D5P3B3_9EURY|nr:MMPL family transporter [Halosimplex rubrum]QLH78041.1 MMPL family transporter [Halosimplex rubrum]